VESPLFSPGGAYLAVHAGSGSRAVCRVWRLDEPERPVREAAAARGLRPYDFHPTLPLLAVGGPGGEISFFDLTAPESAAARSFPPAPETLVDIQEVSFDPRGSRFAVSSRTTAEVAIRETAGGELIGAIPYATQSIAWHPEGMYLAAVRAGLDIDLVQLDSLKPRSGQISDNHGKIQEIVFSANGVHLASATDYRGVFLWNHNTCRLVLRCPGGTRVQFSRDGSRLAITRPPVLEIYDLAGGDEFKVLRDPRRLSGQINVRSVAFAQDERLLVATTAEQVFLYDLETGRTAGSTLFQGAIPVNGNIFGGLLFSQGTNSVLHWPVRALASDGGTGKARLGPPEILAEESGWSACRSRTGDCSAVLCGSQIRPRLLVRREPGPWRQLELEGAWMIDLSDDGRWLAAGTRRGPYVRVWETASGGLVADLDVAGPACPVFSPDASRLLCGGMNEYVAFSTDSWSPKWRLAREPGRNPGSACFSSDGSVVALVTASRAVTLYEAETAVEIASFRAPELERPGYVALSPSSRYLVVYYGFGTLYSWDLGAIARSLTRMGLADGMPEPPEDTQALAGRVELEVAR
jgi:WD40 repeat protein